MTIRTNAPSSLPSEKEFGFLVVKTDGFLRFCQNIRDLVGFRFLPESIESDFLSRAASKTAAIRHQRSAPHVWIVAMANGDVRSHFSLQVAIQPSTARNNGLFTSLYCQQVGWTDSSSSSVSQGTTNWNQ
jgi:hypothetical protein